MIPTAAVRMVSVVGVGVARRSSAREGKDRRALISCALGHGFLRQSDMREDHVKVHGRDLIAKSDPNRVEAFIEAMKELGGEVDLGKSVIDVGHAVSDELHTTRIFIHTKIALLEVAILSVEDHEPGNAIGEEVVIDLLLESEGGGGADDMIHRRVGKGDIDPKATWASSSTYW
ncbi:hypothetical protein D1007_04548 [Hordeum vulgare]|nr:hypothetical protein D1007_04548 [Hordeum vulgare]